jgi:hypothetical protein
MKLDKVLVALCVALLAGFVTFSLWATYIQRAPLDQPISLFPARRVEERVRLPLAEHYRLQLAFEKSERSNEEMRRLIGGWEYSVKDGS